MLEKCIITGFADEIDSSIDKQIKLLKKLGVNHIEFRSGDGKGVADYTISEAIELKKRLDAEKISISAIGSPIGKIGIRDAFEAHFEKFKHVVELAHVLDTPYIRMFSFYVPEGTEVINHREEVMRRMASMISYAKENKVIILHENEKGIYGDNAERCLDLFQTLGCEHFQCIFDFANFVQSGQNTLEAYEMLKSYIAYIHVKDAMWVDGKVVPAGEGDGHVEEIFSKLDAEGFSGFLSLEPHLAGFAAFKNLEQNGRKPEMTDGEYAWEVAYNSAIKILGRK